jgi:hypothetical protein
MAARYYECLATKRFEGATALVALEIFAKKRYDKT